MVADKALDLLEQNKGNPLGVAVSGGGDSMALLWALMTAAKSYPTPIYAASINHGLRPEAQREAEYVGQFCQKHNLPHEIITWETPDKSGNLMANARNARYALLANWAAAKKINAIALGHTQDDQAETFLLRLARGSGAIGLSGMAAQTNRLGLTWHRPFLEISRANLRRYLRGHGVAWIDDPTNDNPQYDRIKMRQAQEQLDGLGLTAKRLSATAKTMARTRDMIEYYVEKSIKECASTYYNQITINRNIFQDAPLEIQLRLLSSALQWVGRMAYAPRMQALETLINAPTPSRHSLAGCIIRWNKNHIHIFREYAAIDKSDQNIALWDGIWQIDASLLPDGVSIGALGPGGVQIWKDWQGTPLNRAAAMALPALWQGDALYMVPLHINPEKPAPRIVAKMICPPFVKKDVS